MTPSLPHIGKHRHLVNPPPRLSTYLVYGCSLTSSSTISQRSGLKWQTSVSSGFTPISGFGSSFTHSPVNVQRKIISLWFSHQILYKLFYCSFQIVSKIVKKCQKLHILESKLQNTVTLKSNFCMNFTVSVTKYVEYFC